MTTFSKNPLHALAALSALALIAATQGAWDIECDQCDRTEFVTRGAGDAVAVNKATQTIDPWPAHACNRHLTMNGRRAGLAMQRYEVNRQLAPHLLNPIKAAEQPTPDQALQAPQAQQ